ncbi:DUF2294 family protein [Mesobacillus boroniphilus]|uniref:DUF2294 family protein n=1 Tax=Mesobacillus boroniphilus TaxID=308892 RepID=A0A944GY27_9BACI|nr:Na-translocating system protein MpsC family protein [Mesobacillus boroniphilus]MBS8266498.1 DUF2294 family protein [Mesobacillus boroniphilus]
MNVLSKNAIEKEFANFLSYYIKENLGRGPRETKIKITDNVLVFFMKGILTPMERNILKSSDGLPIALEARRLYLKGAGQERIQAFEKIVGMKIVEHYEAWKLEEDAAVGVLVFEENIT